MTPVTRNEAIWSIDDLELELRKLPGVRAAGFDDVDDMLMVQLHVTDTPERSPRNERGDQPVPVSASRIAARHSDRPVAVEIVRWRSVALPVPPPPAPPVAPVPPVASTPTRAPDRPEVPAAPAPIASATPELASESHRIRLLAVLAFPDTDELEVHLVLDGRRTIGRAPASTGIDGAVVATIDAIRDLDTGVNARMEWARALDDDPGREQVAVAVAVTEVDPRSSLNYGLAAGTSLVDAAARATLDALNRRLSRAR
jgi:hypothetical protein